jgi:hypothetical protein
MPNPLPTMTLYSGPLSMYGAKVHSLLDWRRRIAARPAVQPTLVQMILTLTRQGHPVPQFMTDAVHGRTA